MIRSAADVMFATGGTGFPPSSSESGSNSILYVSALIGFAPAILLEYGAKSLSLAGIVSRNLRRVVQDLENSSLHCENWW